MAYDAYLVRVPPAETAGFLDDSGAVAGAMERGRARRGASLELGEAWAPLHFVLTDEVPIPRDEALRRGLEVSDNPLEEAILGGEPTPSGTTYGVVRFLPPDAVRRVAGALAGVAAETVEARYDPDWVREMRVPMVWADTEAEERAWLGDSYRRLVAFYRDAAAAGDAVLSYLL
jgi:hypothetical protein